jgi:hypothetical protein
MSYNNSNKLNTARRNKLMQIQEREGAKTANPARLVIWGFGESVSF